MLLFIGLGLGFNLRAKVFFLKKKGIDKVKIVDVEIICYLCVYKLFLGELRGCIHGVNVTCCL